MNSSELSKRVFTEMCYNPYASPDPRSIPGYNEASRIIKQIIRDFVNNKKVINSRSVAIALVQSHYVDGDKIICPHHIDEAWAIGAGGGLEFEWERE